MFINVRILEQNQLHWHTLRTKNINVRSLIAPSCLPSITLNSMGQDFSRTTSDDNEQKPDDNEQEPDDNNDELRRSVSLEDTMLKKLKDDLKKLPEDQGLDEFKDVPIEGFGAVLFARYGWSEGMGIGKNAKDDVKVVEYKPRIAKAGLGFVRN